MENKGIWDLITKLSAPLKDKTATEEKANDANSPQENSTEEEQSFLLSGSHLKSYNPFASPLIKKPQISSARAERPPRAVIDLRSSKNLANGKAKDKTHNIIELINRHNYYSHKITKKPPNG